jgi:hypothetical protein
VAESDKEVEREIARLDAARKRLRVIGDSIRNE